MFIVFEGIDGCGKTTQINAIATRLREVGRRVVVTRQPGGTALGTHLRSLLLDSKEDISPVTELLLFAADRSHHVQQIREELKAGSIVLCDRFSDSTKAYQGFGRGLSLELIDQLNAIATGGLTPDLTFWIATPVEVCLSRLGKQDRIELEGLAFRERVNRGYKAIAFENFRRVAIIDGKNSKEMVAEDIWRILSAQVLA